VISFGAIISLFVFVLPLIFAISDQFPGMQLPWITVMLKDFSEFLATNVLYVLGAIAFLIFGGMAFGSTKQ
jgi:type II secretory pathway component PulF